MPLQLFTRRYDSDARNAFFFALFIISCRYQKAVFCTENCASMHCILAMSLPPTMNTHAIQWMYYNRYLVFGIFIYFVQSGTHIAFEYDFVLDCQRWENSCQTVGLLQSLHLFVLSCQYVKFRCYQDVEISVSYL